MISVTPAAASYLRSLIRHSRGQPGQVVKLLFDGKNGLVMTMSQPSEGDTVLEDGSGPVLVIEPALAARLDGLVFDQIGSEVDGRAATTYSFRRPTGDELTGGLDQATPATV